METRLSFTLMSIDEFEQWLAGHRVARTVLYLQQHHTLSPNYALFTGNNHFELQKGMRDYHVQHNGWSDIGQHFTIFPDGTIMTGRNIESTPACIYGNNSGAICFEHLGNFDKGKDAMRPEQRASIIRASAAVCKKFGIPVNSDRIVYHHWFNLNTGARNNGAGNNKSCPGTNFFGGNKVADCVANFLPLIGAHLEGFQAAPRPAVTKYVAVMADSLNIRTGPAASAPLAADRAPALAGAILRVYEEKGGWLRISASEAHWVKGQHTQEVWRARVNADTLNVRNLPSAAGEKVGAFRQGQELFIVQRENGWSRISGEGRWVKTDYLTFGG